MNRSALNPETGPAPAPWKQRYEALRQLAVAGNLVFEVDPLGLVLLLRQGVAGWMHSWSGQMQTTTAAAVPAPPTPAVPTSQRQQQLTELLAQMSLAHLPGNSAL
jgi:hypothetical protein